MEQLIEDLTRGNVTEVKVVLASVVLALAAYQLLLAAVAYGRLRPPFLSAGAAGWGHRASGDAVAVLALVVATMCIAVYGFEGDAHTVAGCAALLALALKVAAVRRGGGLGRRLPLIGAALALSLALAWLTSAGEFLGVG